MNTSISPSRTYVAMCNNSDFNEYRFYKFHLPESDCSVCHNRCKNPTITKEIENGSDLALWYFINILDDDSVERVFPVEDLGVAGSLVELHPRSLPVPKA